MGIGRPEISHISILGPILTPMKRGTLRPCTGKYGFGNRLEHYIFELSIHVASFQYNHCFGANMVPRELVIPKFRTFPFSALYCTPSSGVLCGPALVSTVSAPTTALDL